MDNRVKNKAVEDFTKHIFTRIFPLFEKADKKKLEKAFASKNLLAVSKALGISEKELKTILGKGQKMAFKVFENFLGLRDLIERMEEFLKKRGH